MHLMAGVPLTALGHSAALGSHRKKHCCGEPQQQVSQPQAGHSPPFLCKAGVPHTTHTGPPSERIRITPAANFIMQPATTWHLPLQGVRNATTTAVRHMHGLMQYPPAQTAARMPAANTAPPTAMPATAPCDRPWWLSAEPAAELPGGSGGPVGCSLLIGSPGLQLHNASCSQ